MKNALPLVASDDHVLRLARERDPIRAIAELIWNSLDAEANNVHVKYQRSDLDAIETVIVEDDGHGITSDEVPSTFGRIGGSWKKMAARTKNDKRNLHGKLGEGRLRAFALGARVQWVSESVNAAGEHEQVLIEGFRDANPLFSWDAAPSTATKTGTVFTALNEQERSLNVLNSDNAVPTLRAHFAPAMLNEPSLVITVDSATLDPSHEILYDTPLTAPIEGQPGQSLSIRIIEWKSGKHRAIYFGVDDQHFLYEAPGSELENVLPYSAYVTWSGFDEESLSELGLGDMSLGVSGDIWRAAQRAVREHFAARRRDKRREQVRQWKQSGVYPYKGEPTSEPERAERAVFDVVSSALAPQIAKVNKSSAQLTLTLLREAIQTDPENLGALLSEYVALSEEERQALSKLLSETTLAAIIRSANLVTSRHKFLLALENMLFHPEQSELVKERDHLHRVLERELWIFGEQYNLMNSERSLTELLRTQLNLEGLPTKDIEPVKQWGEKTGRVDLHFAARALSFDVVRHLVVELKAPEITASRKERDQVENYYNAIATNAAFANAKAIYDFVLVVTDFDEMVENSIKPEDKATGLLYASTDKPGHPEVRVYVRRWREVIDENRRRLEFFTKALEHDPSLPEGLAFLREKFGDILPSEVTGTDEPSGPKADAA